MPPPGDYDAALRDVTGVDVTEVAADVYAVYHLYVVMLEERDDVKTRLDCAGIESGIHYPVPLHLQPAYGELGYGVGDFPVAESRARKILSLPMFPELTQEQQDRVVEALTRSIR